MNKAFESLGPYKIVAPLGAGGMGEVFRAHDLKLDRDVAIKILPARFAVDPERRARFAREARLLATLNHPNIGAIYGVEEAGGLTALVLELVEGPTLAHRLDHGLLPLSDSLAIARQIAEALDAAHEKRIVHRDLKPTNIVVQGTSRLTSGAVRAKVLDFGIAKAMSAGGEASSKPLDGSLESTAEGRILGTPAYMSPEQARGLPTDKRTDIWAFGCILFEMLSGRRAFDGKTAADTIAHILEHEPDWDRLPPTTPEPVRTLVRRCLAKDPSRRLRDIGDAPLDLDERQWTDRSVGPSEGRRAERFPSWRWIAATSVLMIASSAVGRFLWLTPIPPPAQRPVMQLDVDLGPDVSLASGVGPAVAISPNGDRLVFVSNRRLMARRLAESTSVSLAGTEGVSTFFFSPDGKEVAFVADNKLKRLPIDGGSVETICVAPPEVRGGSWGEGDIIVFAGLFGGLFRVSAAGGQAESLTRLSPGELTHRWPQVLPGGKAVLFTSQRTPSWGGLATVDVLSLVDGRRRTLQEHATFGRFATDSDGGSYLIFVRGDTIFAAAFDPLRLELLSKPSPVFEQIGYDDTGAAQVDASRTGDIVIRAQNKVRLTWLESSGSTLLPVEAGDYRAPAVSRDGNRVAFSSAEDAWVYDVERHVRTQVTKQLFVARPKIWTFDDRFIVFSTPEGIFCARADGGSEPRQLLPSVAGLLRFATSIGRDRHTTRLAFNSFTPGGGASYDLWTVPIMVDERGIRAGNPEPYLQTKNDERDLDFSPDGQWVAYSSNEEGGRQEVYVRAFPNDGRRWKISDGGGATARWSPGRPDLFFVAERLLMVAPYSVNAGVFAPGKPRVWSRQSLVIDRGPAPFSVAPDGRRVAAIVPDIASEQRSRQNVTVWVNGLAEFRRRIPIQR